MQGKLALAVGITAMCGLFAVHPVLGLIALIYVISILKNA